MWSHMHVLGLVLDAFGKGIFKRFAMLLGDFAGNQDETVL